MNKETKKLLVKIAVVGGLSLAESFLRKKLEDIKEDNIENKLNDIREEIKNANVINNISNTNLSDEQLASIIRMSEDEMEQKIVSENGSYSSIEHGVVGTDEHGKHVQGIKLSVGNIAAEVEPVTVTRRFRVRLPESAIEVSPDEIAIKGDTIKFGKEVKLVRYEEQVSELAERVSKLEDWNTPMKDPEPIRESDKSPVLQGAIDTENFSFPSTLKEYNNLYKSTCDLVNKLDTDNLEKLNVIWSGSYMYDMKDFHSLVAQLFVIQEAPKKKGND